MTIALSPEHHQLAEVVRAFGAANDLRAATRAALEGDPDDDPGTVWKQIANQGWLGLHIAEDVGGSGFGLAELAVVIEELGRIPAPGPMLSTAVAAAVVESVGTAEQRAALLPGLIDGTTPASVTVPLSEGVSTADTALLQLGGRWATTHLVAVGTDDLAVVAAAQATAQPVAGLDPTLGLTRVGGPGSARVEVLVGGRTVARRVLRALAAAEASGGARACLEAARDYAAVREQFNRVIGGFQAVKHHLADMLVRAELATAAAWNAARTDGGGPQSELAAAEAALVAGDAYERNARMQIQILGGIGFTWEHDAHLYLRRATALRALALPQPDACADVLSLTRGGVRPHEGVALPAEADQYRAEVAEFLTQYQAAPEHGRRDLLVDSGYLVPHWPRPWGRSAGPVEQICIEDALTGVEMPELGIGGWVLQTLIQTGSAEQVQRWVGAGLRGQTRWCQLFSEPGAGSDAAAVASRALRVDGGWRVTGQKVWTSDAQNCDMGLATVRTDPSLPKHKGITAMAIDLSAPGVTVRPLREITGAALFNEIFLDDVFVPDDDVVGDVNGGWAVARATLGNERVSIGRAIERYMSAVELVALLDRYTSGGAALAGAVSELIAVERAIRWTNLREVERAVLGAGSTAAGNLTKLAVAEHTQAVTELGIRIAGPAGVTDQEPALVNEYLYNRAMTIAGGTSEITRNVIAERALGLPREPQPAPAATR